jgi:hypothetical protein
MKITVIATGYVGLCDLRPTSKGPISRRHSSASKSSQALNAIFLS